MDGRDIAVIGAGMAGLACAQRLAARGASVRVFEKARGVGGRMATRRIETTAGLARLDHGAQFFTARDPRFADAVRKWALFGCVGPWDVETSPVQADDQGAQRHVGVPTMSGLPKAMAKGLDVSVNARVIAIEGGRGAWTLRFADSEATGPFRSVVVSAPAPQTAELLDGVAPQIALGARSARLEPCWAAMLVFDHGAALSFVDGEQAGEGAIRWLARQDLRGVRGGPPAVTAHAGAAWSRANLELAPEDALEALIADLRERVPDAPAPVAAQAHRWRHARVEEPVGVAFAWDEQTGIGACGDWHLGPRVELAWLSGDALGGRIAL